MAWLGWAVAAVLLLGVGGSAVAAGLAGEDREGGAGGYVVPGAGAAVAGPGHRARGGFRGVRAPVRGELTVPGEGGSFEQVVFARGEVTAISEDSLSIKSADGTVTTFALNGDTRYGRGRDLLERGDVEVGAQALAMGPRDGQTITARRVLLRQQLRRPGNRAPAPSTTQPPTTTT